MFYEIYSRYCRPLLGIFLTQANAPLYAEQQTAKERGLALYNQYKTTSAILHLRVAAQAGDSESKYFLGEAIFRSKRHIIPEAQSANEAATLQGDVYSMIRLVTAGSDLEETEQAKTWRVNMMHQCSLRAKT